jgi:hypothetical protein
MARSKFGYSDECFRIESVKTGHPAFVASADIQRSIVITVPAGALWEFLYGWDSITSTATVGTRVLQIIVRDTASTIVLLRNAPITVAASSVLNTVLGDVGTDGSSSTSTAFATLPKLIFPEGYTLTLRVATGIDVADVHTFAGVVKEYC